MAHILYGPYGMRHEITESLQSQDFTSDMICVIRKDHISNTSLEHRCYSMVQSLKTKFYSGRSHGNDFIIFWYHVIL